ncbi:MAG: phosphopentomutase [Lachnospiraceae bacterium]|nr:phosphopentomutase [Lachnospiraceae bacterium]
MKRVFCIVLDSFGIGEMPDAEAFGDAGSNTFRSVWKTGELCLPNLFGLGFSAIDGVRETLADGTAGVCRRPCGETEGEGRNGASFSGSVARLAERSRGKDTTTGHWEMTGIVRSEPMPTFPHGFPNELIDRFSAAVGRGVLCNRPYSGTEVIRDYGREHLETGKLIVYTSADSVFQIAAHEDLVSPEELYGFCRIARELCQGEYGVGRVIARPFTGAWPFERTKRRRDFSLTPPKENLLSVLNAAGYSVRAVGKIEDIFAGQGITHAVHTKDNEAGMEAIAAELREEFEGLCFVNLVDFDMLYGHRNDAEGYARALNAFDKRLPQFLELLGPEDVLMITADHGCDPGTPSTDHSREYVPFLAVGAPVCSGKNLGTRRSFADVGKTILAYFGVENDLPGEAMDIFLSGAAGNA